MSLSIASQSIFLPFPAIAALFETAVTGLTKGPAVIVGAAVRPCWVNHETPCTKSHYARPLYATPELGKMGICLHSNPNKKAMPDTLQSVCRTCRIRWRI